MTNLNFPDFEKQISAGNIKPVYFVSANGNYFVKKAADLLSKKLFGGNESNDGIFTKYADETKADELIDFCRNFTSLFSFKKMLVVKRCEKFSRNLKPLLEYTSKPDPDTVLVLVFDSGYVSDSKLTDNYSFYDFSQLPNDYFLKWVAAEFRDHECNISEKDLSLFVSLLPYDFDLIVQEIEKLSNYIEAGTDSKKDVTREIILSSTGFVETFTPEELMESILGKDVKRCTDITHNLLYKSGINEIYLVSILMNYYLDLLTFKTKGLNSLNSYEIYSRYRIWRERAEFAGRQSKKIEIKQFEGVFKHLLETDKKLKTSMVDPKILMTSLMEDLINS